MMATVSPSSWLSQVGIGGESAAALAPPPMTPRLCIGILKFALAFGAFLAVTLLFLRLFAAAVVLPPFFTAFLSHSMSSSSLSSLETYSAESSNSYTLGRYTYDVCKIFACFDNPDPKNYGNLLTPLPFAISMYVICVCAPFLRRALRPRPPTPVSDFLTCACVSFSCAPSSSCSLRTFDRRGGRGMFSRSDGTPGAPFVR